MHMLNWIPRGLINVSKWCPIRNQISAAVETCFVHST